MTLAEFREAAMRAIVEGGGLGPGTTYFVDTRDHTIYWVMLYDADGAHGIDAIIRDGEPTYFEEYQESRSEINAYRTRYYSEPFTVAR